VTKLPAALKNSIPKGLVDHILDRFIATHPGATNYLVLDVFSGYGSVAGATRLYSQGGYPALAGKRLVVVTNDIMNREMVYDGNLRPDYNQNMRGKSSLLSLCQLAVDKLDLSLEFTNPSVEQVRQFYKEFGRYVPQGAQLHLPNFHNAELVWYRGGGGADPVKAQIVVIQPLLPEDASQAVIVKLLLLGRERNTTVDQLTKYIPALRT